MYSLLLNNVWLVLSILALCGAFIWFVATLSWKAAQFFIGMRNDINLILTNHLVHLQADILSIKKHIGMAE